MERAKNEQVAGGVRATSPAGKLSVANPLHLQAQTKTTSMRKVDDNLDRDRDWEPDCWSSGAKQQIEEEGEGKERRSEPGIGRTRRQPKGDKNTDQLPVAVAPATAAGSLI